MMYAKRHTIIFGKTALFKYLRSSVFNSTLLIRYNETGIIINIVVGWLMEIESGLSESIMIIKFFG